MTATRRATWKIAILRGILDRSITVAVLIGRSLTVALRKVYTPHLGAMLPLPPRDSRWGKGRTEKPPLTRPFPVRGEGSQGLI
jgi:hypothetical protein